MPNFLDPVGFGNMEGIGELKTIDQIDPSFNESNWMGELFD